MLNEVSNTNVEDVNLAEKKRKNIKTKETLICNYSKSIVNPNGDIDGAKKAIEEFRKELLADTSIIEGQISNLNAVLSNKKITDK